jgi:hypothetical protein
LNSAKRRFQPGVAEKTLTMLVTTKGIFGCARGFVAIV